jgi:hypothetical protein
MLKTVRWLSVIALLLLVGVSCQFNLARSVDSKANTVENWWNVWLAQPVCQPPCWENITPGVTTYEAAISILESKPEIEITFTSEHGADWQFTRNNDEGGTLSASKDGIVRMIWLGSLSDRKLRLHNIVEAYNYPIYVKPYDCREGMCSTALIYPELGMFLNVHTENKGSSSEAPRIEISPDTVVERVYFIEPGRESFLNLYQLEDTEVLFDWIGFSDYPK